LLHEAEWPVVKTYDLTSPMSYQLHLHNTLITSDPKCMPAPVKCIWSHCHL